MPTLPDTEGFMPLRWQGYDLLATGGGQRLENWGGRVILRPETSAVWPWKSGIPLPDWEGRYTGERATGGKWEWRNPLPHPCNVRRGDLSFEIRPTNSKHLGLFPEQAPNWDWISDLLLHNDSPKNILNLFGYTGGATLAAAKAGAAVTHVDSSKAMVSWCSENARLSALEKAPIRYLVEDAMTFLRREHRRGTRYDGIIMDPPTYGRGSRGQLWKLEEHLPLLLETAAKTLSDTPLFFLISTYSPALDGMVSELLMELLAHIGGDGVIHSPTLTGELDGRELSLGRSHRWTFPM